MRRKFVLLGCIAFIWFTGCQSATDRYKEAIKETGVLDTTQSIGSQAKILSQALQPLLTWQIDQLGEDLPESSQVVIECDDFSKLVEEAMSSSEKLPAKKEMVTIQATLEEGLTLYQEWALTASSIAQMNQEIQNIVGEIEKSYAAILDLTVSEDTTSQTYRDTLEAWMSEYRDTLLLLDLESAKTLFSKDILDIDSIQKGLQNSEAALTVLKNIPRETATDEEVHGHLITMYSEMMQLYTYIIDHQAAIGKLVDGTYVELLNQQQAEGDSKIEDWQKQLGFTSP